MTKVVEINAAPVIYADDIAHVEIVGSNVRITFVEERTVDGEKVWNVVATVVRPLERLQRNILDRLTPAGSPLINEAVFELH